MKKSTMSSSSTSMKNELLKLVESFGEDGISDNQLRDHFGDRYLDCCEPLNELLTSNRLKLLETPNGDAKYGMYHEETAHKLEGLGREQMLVYGICDKAGNKGIWKQDIRLQSNIPQGALDKIIKTLEQRLLIKSVRSIGSKTKRLYMLYEIAPAKEVTGGPWYTDQEFDYEFVDALTTFILQVIKTMLIVNLEMISSRVKKSGISRIELNTEDLDQVLQTFIYDGKVEEVSNAVLQFTNHPLANTPGKKYKLSKEITIPNHLTEIPCGVCPVSHKCCDGGEVSPHTCEYMTAWLENSIKEDSDVDMSW